MTSFIVMCEGMANASICPKTVSSSLEDAKTQMAANALLDISEGQTSYPLATFTSHVSNDGMATIVKMQQSNNRSTDVNGINYPELVISNVRESVYCKLYIVSV